MSVSRSPGRFRDAMPVTTAARLVEAFLDRHVDGLEALAAATGRSDAMDALHRVRRLSRARTRDTKALARDLETLRDRVDEASAALGTPLPCVAGQDVDAAARWYAGRLTDLADLCRRM
jgi:hypothetical protein